jgi:group I intron endonuclease
MGRTQKYSKIAGIYKITCKINGKIYIGKSHDVRRRIRRYEIFDKNKKSVRYFESALVKYGWESFEVETLESIVNFDKLLDNQYLLERESYYIELFDSNNPEKGYNICAFSCDFTGCKHTEETKEKIRKTNLGKKRGPHTPESIEKMRISKLGQTHSEETKMKISQAKLGSKHGRVGLNAELTEEYYNHLDIFLHQYGLHLDIGRLNSLKEIGIYRGELKLGNISLRILRNITNLDGLYLDESKPMENLDLVDKIYSFHFTQALSNMRKVKISLDEDNNYKMFRKTFKKHFTIIKRPTQMMAILKK